MDIMKISDKVRMNCYFIFDMNDNYIECIEK